MVAEVKTPSEKVWLWACHIHHNVWYGLHRRRLSVELLCCNSVVNACMLELVLALVSYYQLFTMQLFCSFRQVYVACCSRWENGKSRKNRYSR